MLRARLRTELLLVVVWPPVGVVSPFHEERPLAVRAGRVVFAEIAIVVVVVALVEALLVISMVAPSIVFIVALLVLLILLGPEAKTTWVLERDREVDWRERGVEGLRLRRGERVAEVVLLAVPRLKSSLAVEVSGGI